MAGFRSAVVPVGAVPVFAQTSVQTKATELKAICKSLKGFDRHHDDTMVHKDSLKANRKYTFIMSLNVVDLLFCSHQY